MNALVVSSSSLDSALFGSEPAEGYAIGIAGKVIVGSVSVLVRRSMSAVIVGEPPRTVWRAVCIELPVDLAAHVRVAGL